MVTTSALAGIASLIADPARAAMLQALMGGEALTAGELAKVAGMPPRPRVRICPGWPRAAWLPFMRRDAIATTASPPMMSRARSKG
jgi:hypothetical protein